MRKFLWIAFAIVASAVFIASMIYRARRVEARVDISKVEKDLSDHLRVGDSRAAVEAYLDQHGIQHSYVEQSKGAPEYDHTEFAMIRGASRTWLVRGDIQIVFKFDDKDELVHYSAREIFTGP
jgi:hypothetical protein